MANEIIYKTNSLFQSLTYDKGAQLWNFVFDDNIYFNVYTLWRLLEYKKIKWVSFDNEQQFGLTKPIDLAKEINDLLIDKKLTEIKVKQDTADLVLSFSENILIEIFISSSGYESYSFSFNNKDHIGMGSGDIVIFNNKI